MRIVIVDPDSEFRQGLVTQLRRRQFDTVGAADAASLYRDLAAHPCDVVILDPDLPGENGFSVASYLRNTSHVGIVMVSLEASLERRLECLASGADACLAKPIDLRELVATLATLSRRVNRSHAAIAPVNGAAADWTLLANNWQLVSPTGACIALTSYECSLLSLLMQKKGAAVSRQEIVAEFGLDYRHYDERRLEAIVSRLRRKLEPHQGGSKPLQTAHGFGYAFTAPAIVR
ncbi:response regulator transcription factor [Paraburkholderia sp.]|jgi:DNA-binding response OmpR family regulator|uniref:response regulator transcription factor n=1 Tax=Paraburkholderia sp. TaxID=1926495 RepID=UPI003C79B393